MVCSKCGVDKEEKNYQKYFHSKQQKWRQRRECTECLYSQRKKNMLIQSVNKEIIVQPEVLKEEPKVSKTINTKEKICLTCNETKSVDDFYTSRKTCKKCCLQKEYLYRTEKTYLNLDNNGGSLRVKTKPGEYHDEYQRYYTNELMIAMGWTYNKEKNLYWKLPFREEDGYYPTIRKTKPETYVDKIRKYGLVKSEITKDNIPKLKLKNRRKSTPSDEIINNLTYDYFVNKISYSDLYEKYNMSMTLIYMYIRMCYKKIIEDIEN